MNKYQRIIILTAAVIVLAFYTGRNFLFAEEDHDHAAHSKEAEKHDDDHAGDEHDHLGEAEEAECDCASCATDGKEAADEHEGHDHASHADDAEAVDDGHDHAAHADEAECDGHDHAAHAGETASVDDGHGDEAIQLDAETEELIGIKTAKAGVGQMRSAIRLTGQIRLNEDNLAHIVPLTSGIVRKVNKSIGDKVAKDEILAWIESSELGQAKIEYLEIMAEIGCCAMLLPRAQLIHDNSLELIEMLKKRPALDELRKIDGMEMGLNRSILVKAYAEYVLAKSAYEREKSLFDEKITSREELLKTENLLKKTEAEFVAFLDTTTFEVKQALMEAQRDQNSQEILLKGAERTLYVLGLREEDIAVLAGLGQNQTEDGEQKVECSDPNCEDCKKKAELAKLAKDAKADFTKLGWYPLRAPFDGIVIDKHITIGERLGEDSAAFTIADMNTVWIDLDIFAKDMFTVSKGQAVTISLGDLTGKAEISFVSPLLDVKTRTATARIILDNKSGMFRPGSFVTAEIDGKSYTASVVVAKDAVQTMENRKCVFIKDSDGYEPRFVTVGRSDSTHAEITAGLEKGEEYVTHGAFDLKAKVVTSTLDSHAGHGH